MTWWRSLLTNINPKYTPPLGLHYYILFECGFQIIIPKSNCLEHVLQFFFLRHISYWKFLNFLINFLDSDNLMALRAKISWIFAKKVSKMCKSAKKCKKAKKQDTEDLSIDYPFDLAQDRFTIDHWPYLRHELTILSDLRDLGGKSEIVLIRDSRTSGLGFQYLLAAIH